MIYRDDYAPAYSKANALTRPPSLAMIVTLVLVVILIVLHGVVADRIFSINQPILFVLFAFNYVFLIVVAIDYFILLTVDPTDPRLLIDAYEEKGRDMNLLVYCNECRRNVHVYSYHCKKCKRCAEEFDHHCIFLNTCIGSKNYRNFFRIMLTLSCFLMINIGEGVWVGLADKGERRWVGVALAGVAALILPQILGLLGFHCYISVCLYKTTLQVIRGELSPQKRQEIELMSPRRKGEANANGVNTQTSIIRQDRNF